MFPNLKKKLMNLVDFWTRTGERRDGSAQGSLKNIAQDVMCHS